MRHSPEQLARFEAEAKSWAKRRRIDGCWEWRTAEEHFGAEAEKFPSYCYFVIIDENDFDDVLSGVPGDHANYDAHKRYAPEFEAILEKHSLWWEPEDNVTFLILGDDRERGEVAE